MIKSQAQGREIFTEVRDFNIYESSVIKLWLRPCGCRFIENIACTFPANTLTFALYKYAQ